MSYLDVRSDLFQRVFRDAVPYRDCVLTGNDRGEAAWQRADAALPTPSDEVNERLDPVGLRRRLSEIP